MMVAQTVGMVPGQLVHMIADAHIYDRHVDIVRELISRPQHAAPRVSLNPEAVSYTHLGAEAQGLAAVKHEVLLVHVCSSLILSPDTELVGTLDVTLPNRSGG